MSEPSPFCTEMGDMEFVMTKSGIKQTDGVHPITQPIVNPGLKDVFGSVIVWQISA